jgi:hypothetical protein
LDVIASILTEDPCFLQEPEEVEEEFPDDEEEEEEGEGEE